MAKDMTTGKITPLLISFTIPLVLGNVFQLMYNAVDSMIVGRFVGEEALAAVGTSNPLMTLIILFINGLCMGAGVLISMLYGAKDYEKLQKQISSTMIGGLLFSIFTTVLSVAIAPLLLRILQTDEVILPEATRYLRIILMGLMFTFIYNCYASMLRALGDSKSPLLFLMISAVVNIIGDLFFVILLKWGSEGCAIATVLSEALSCLMCAIYIKKKVPLLCLGKRWLSFDKKLFMQTVSYGWTSAMQQATVQLGKIGIQAMVNTMGVSAMAAFAAVNRIDDFAYTPQQNIGHAMTTFIAQNKGAGKVERIKKGFAGGLLIEVVYSCFLFVVIILWASGIMQLFAKNESAQVVEMGVAYLRLIAIMYILPGFTNGIQGFFRGIGDMKVTLYSTFMNMLGRVVAVALLLRFYKLGFGSLAWANMIGWIVMLLFEVPLLVKSLSEMYGKEEDVESS